MREFKANVRRMDYLCLVSCDAVLCEEEEENEENIEELREHREQQREYQELTARQAVIRFLLPEETRALVQKLVPLEQRIQALEQAVENLKHERDSMLGED